MKSKRRSYLTTIGLAVALLLTACAGQGQVPLLYDPLIEISDVKVREVQPLNFRVARTSEATRALVEMTAPHVCSGMR